MLRNLPQGAYDLVRRFEAGPDGTFAATRYEDPAGSGEFSIGWGHHILAHEKWVEPISADEADAQMEIDISNASMEVDRLVVPAALADLTDNQYAALIDFVFNEGAGHLASSTLLKMVNSHAFGRAADELLRWDYVQGEPSKGLLNRREAERTLWLS